MIYFFHCYEFTISLMYPYLIYFRVIVHDTIFLFNFLSVLFRFVPLLTVLGNSLPYRFILFALSHLIYYR